MSATLLRDLITITHQLPPRAASSLHSVIYTDAADAAAGLPAPLLASLLQCDTGAECPACTAVADAWVETPRGVAEIYYLDIHSKYQSNDATDPTIRAWRAAFPEHLHPVCDAAIEAGEAGLVDSLSLPEFTDHVLRQRVPV